MNPSNATIEAVGLTKRYRGPKGELTVLDKFDLAVAPGEFVAVRGPSGCGKSTLLLILGGMLEPDAGSVRIAGKDLYALDSAARAGLRAADIGFVFQQFHLVPYLSVRDNVLAPSLATKIPEAGKRADELIARFGLRDRADHVPGQLSTGERQRVALARALLAGPKVLLADEPTGNLDPANGSAVLDALADFARAGGAVVLVTHEADAAARAGRTVELKRG